MKKTILMLLLTILLMFPFIVLADVDLKAMSYDELVELSKQVGIAIMTHDNFDSVSVPNGIWEVGVDIPEGVWILSSSDKGYVNVTYGSTLDETGNSMNMFERGNVDQDLEDDEVWKVNAKSGNYFYIKYGSVTFTSDTGTTSLGFKKK